MKNKPRTNNDYKTDLIDRLKDEEYAVGYLNEVLNLNDEKTFLLALRDVVEAKGGMAFIARKSKLNRENLFRVLSKNGNPEFRTLVPLLEALGLRLVIKSGERVRRAA